MIFARIAVFIAALCSAGSATLPLLTAAPAGCPSWRLSQWSEGSPWSLLVAWPFATLALPLFIAIRWDWCVRKQAEYDTSSVPIPGEYVLARVCLMAAAFSQIPSLMVLDCLTR